MTVGTFKCCGRVAKRAWISTLVTKGAAVHGVKGEGGTQSKIHIESPHTPDMSLPSWERSPHQHNLHLCVPSEMT